MNRDEYWEPFSQEDSDGAEEEAPSDPGQNYLDSDDLEDAAAYFSWEESVQRGTKIDPLRLLEVFANDQEKVEPVAEKVKQTVCKGRWRADSSGSRDQSTSQEVEQETADP